MSAPASRPPGRVRRRHGGVVFSLLICLVVFGAAVVLAWVFLLPSLVEDELRARSGLPVRVRHLVANPFDGGVEMRGVLVRNPTAFQVADFLAISEVRAVVEMGSLFGERIVLGELEVHVERLTLAKDPSGRRNTDLLGEALGFWSERAGPGPGGVGRGPGGGDRDLLVRRLRLRIDRVSLQGADGALNERVVSFDRRFERVTGTAPILRALAEVLQGLGAGAAEYVVPGPR